MKKQILVITATLGIRETLDKTIESVRKVGGEDVRHVLVCPSNKIGILKNKYNNIECIAEPEGNKGIYGAINYGFKQFENQYPYITYINDDDYWMPAYRKIIDAVLKDSTIDFVYGRVLYIDEMGNIVGKQACSSNFRDFIPLLQYNIILMTQQASLIRSNLFFECGGYDERYKIVADTKLWALLSRLPIKYKYVNDYCATYMIQDGQISADEELKAKEHDRLRDDLIMAGRKDVWALFKFRLLNIFVYLERFMKAKQFGNPFENRGGTI
jgi:glycosyltransferase involved in cell wall biosynthesis